MENMTELNLDLQSEKEKPLLKVHTFFLFMLVWSIAMQFVPSPEGTYQPLALFLPCVLYFIFDRQAFRRIIVKFKPLKMSALLIIPLIWICMLPLDITIISTYEALFGDELSTLITSNTVTNPWMLILLTAVTPAVFEELVMRGIILDGYRNKKVHIAAIMNGLIFGMMHLNTFQFTHTFATGIVMTYLVYITGSIFSSMLLHFINNSFPVFIEIFSNPAVSETTEVASTTSSFELFMMFILALIGLFITFKLFKKLCKIYDVNIKEDNNTKVFSHEEIINLPLVGVVLIFILVSALIIIALVLETKGLA
ncbi:CPBP family intramembrane glutamic endopeptidase [Oceanirhabdus seepicola]|uniref:CPBP family intramembrane metalloprotease n=1 Tax=Oceanirhabdus seepicola TaxID=2828781 RepID=A0A9J6P0I2_9CLOT|nr:CPBP family intramembrane glutamic endopeptidase [Oceanirhabdus seepicola]MCM1988952.1 CPBP family intramembrane metalloprotease [Oceanirhabdus seepicola]